MINLNQKLSSHLNRIKWLLALFLIFVVSGVSAQDLPLPQLLGTWPALKSFAIGQSEDYMILALNEAGITKLYETKRSSEGWSNPSPLAAINEVLSATSAIGGLSLNYNSEMLLFHATLADSKGGSDIYYSQRDASGWGKPVNLGSPLNTTLNETYPSISAGQNKILFSRVIPNCLFKKSDESPACQSIWVAYKTPDGKWDTPAELLDMINTGCTLSPCLAVDGKTVVYASINPADDKQGFDIYITKESMEDVWLEPALVLETTSKETEIAPKIAGENLYFIRQTFKKKEEINEVMFVKLPSKVVVDKVTAIKGSIHSVESTKPIEAQLSVFNPTTLQKLGTYYSNAATGEFALPLLNGMNYIVDVRKPGHSFYSFMADLRDDNKSQSLNAIELFTQIELDLSVFDSEIFRPLEAEVVVQDAVNPAALFKGVNSSEGHYTFTLPIGKEYIVKASCAGFNVNQFKFNLAGDVVFSEFKRNLPLEPLKNPFNIFICDAATRQGLAANLKITNLSREEVINFTPEQITNGAVSTKLRDKDKYEFLVQGVPGYSFFNRVMDLSVESARTLTVELISLKADAAIRLNNILFSTNSSVLSAESFPELDRVIKLMNDNPGIIIEIAAHTDNVGNAQFNKVLSEHRAQSVVNYLLENGMTATRLVAKGYGLSSPLVPNTSDENKALNRRVEFKIIEIRQ